MTLPLATRIKDLTEEEKDQENVNDVVQWALHVMEINKFSLQVTKYLESLAQYTMRISDTSEFQSVSKTFNGNSSGPDIKKEIASLLAEVEDGQHIYDDWVEARVTGRAESSDDAAAQLAKLISMTAPKPDKMN